jgi:trehalose-phosphatase
VKNPKLTSPARRKERRIRARVSGEDQIKTARNYLQATARVVAARRAQPCSHSTPRPLFSSWPEVRARIRAARQLAVFLDFDGTLVKLRHRPGDVRVSRRIKRVLQRLARHSNVFVAIVSGRRLRDLQTMFGLQGVHTLGLHGAEREGKQPTLSRTTRRALARAKRDVRSQVGILPGIWLEDKILSLAVHYRGASPAIVREAHVTLLKILGPLRRNLSTMNGQKVWEILPREIAGKGATIQELLAGRAGRTLAIYAGDDAADESAFAAIPDQITVQVGRKKSTCARFHLPNPAEVLRFLTRLERELP